MEVLGYINDVIVCGRNNIRSQRILQKEILGLTTYFKYHISTGAVPCAQLLYIDIASQLVVKLVLGELRWISGRPDYNTAIYIEGEPYNVDRREWELLPQPVMVYPYMVSQSIIAFISDLANIYVYYMLLSSNVHYMFIAVILESKYAYLVLYKNFIQIEDMSDVANLFSSPQCLLSIGLILLTIRICIHESLWHVALFLILCMSQHIRYNYVEYHDQIEYRSKVLILLSRLIFSLPYINDFESSKVPVVVWTSTFLAFCILECAINCTNIILDFGLLLTEKTQIMYFNVFVLGAMVLMMISDISAGVTHNILFFMAKIAIHLAASELYIWLLDLDEFDYDGITGKHIEVNKQFSPTRQWTANVKSGNSASFNGGNELSDAVVFKPTEVNINYLNYIKYLKSNLDVLGEELRIKQ